MKARFSSPLALGLALSILPFVGACTQEGTQSALVNSANAQPVAVTTSNNPPAPVADAVEPVAASAETETGTDAIAAVPEPAPGAERKLPTVVRTNSPALDVIKMAQAGVDETVMLTFITNTTSMFVLTSDEIIYLNDIGVPSTVVTAMMQRDQEIKQFWANAGQPAAQGPVVAATTPTEDAQASAPTYVNPPTTESQPAPVPAAPAQPTVVNNNYFNDTLSPYGTWVDIEGYGRCWQPTVVVVNRGWRPYSDGGRWVYTDAGWYWLSDYSWGATTFHYGRWFNHARWGWCWWPDTVWAPSWVSFRYSNDYCGWAPLPPHAYYRTGLGFSYHGRSVGFSFDFGLSSSCYTFVSWNRFCDSRPWHHRVRSHEVTKIYNNTTIVNNYVTGDNNTVINRGIGRDRVRDFSRTEVKTVNIRDAGPGHAVAGRSERLDRDGRTLVVNRPQFAAARERANSETVRPERAVSTSPARSQNLPPAPSSREISARPVRPERSEIVRAVPSDVKPSPTPTPSVPVSVAPRTDGRPAREREAAISRDARQNTTPPTIIGGSRPATRPAPTATVTQPAITPTPVTPSKVETPTPVARPTRPQQNLIVIGKPQENAPPANRSLPVYSSPQNTSRPVQPQATAPTPVARPQTPAVSLPQRTTAPTPTPARQETPRTTRNFSTPAPAPSRSERPVYSAPSPSVPSVSRPSPSYSPRVSTPTPAPSYTPPAIRPAPPVSAPSYTPRPTPSAPAPSYTPRPAPAAPAPSVGAPRSAPSESRSAPPSGARPESGGRPGR